MPNKTLLSKMSRTLHVGPLYIFKPTNLSLSWTSDLSLPRLPWPTFWTTSWLLGKLDAQSLSFGLDVRTAID